jgi:hypothetical protein
VRDEIGVSTDVGNNAEAEKSAASNNDAEAEKFAASKNLFIIFVHAIFTTLFMCLFTNVLMRSRELQLILACIACATPINSLAT